MFNTPTAIPNLNPDQIKLIETSLGMKLDWEAEITKSYLDIQGDIFSPTDVLDYIYAVLHTPQYRDKYKEFLKIDFPRVPFDVTPEVFWQLVRIGRQLRKLHLVGDQALDFGYIGYPIAGENIVDKLNYVDDKVYINVSQYFDGVSAKAWEFYIGGYQPTQKWLKDRKGLTLSYDDIMYYQRLVASLDATIVLMQELEELNWL
jgi:predicted helicase